MMRRRIEQPSSILTIENGRVLAMTQDTYDYISKLQLKIKELENEKHSIEEELKAIKPILEHKTISPLLAKSVMNASLLYIVTGQVILSDAERTQYAMILFRKIKKESKNGRT